MILPVLHRAARVTAAITFYKQLPEPELGSYGLVEARPEMLDRAYDMHAHYGRTHDAYRKLAEAGHQSSYLLYTEIDFQLSWLISVARAIDALRTWETHQHRHLDRLITVDFVDAFTPLLERQPVRLISIGMAPDRTVPPLNGERLIEAHKADGVLVPQCPVTPVRLSLLRTFEPILMGRQKIPLTPCWDLYVLPQTYSTRPPDLVR